MAKRGRGRPKKSLYSDGTGFFKVFLTSLCSQQLMIPPDFISEYKRTMREKVILRDVDGKSWHIDVKETPDGIFLKNGWQDFVNHHRLSIGEFLVFEYERCYTFVVKIYSTNGCKKEALENVVSGVKIKQENVEELEENRTSHKRPRIHENDPLLSGNERSEHSKRFREENELQEGDLSESPCFISPPICAKNYKLKIPNEAIDKYYLRLEPYMILRNADGKEWLVRTFRLCDTMFLGSGWRAFQIGNNVGSNDKCKFTFERFSRIINVQILPSGSNLSRRMRGRPRKKIANANLVEETVKNTSDLEVPYSYKLPEFFKLYIPSMCCETMRIPPVFIKKFGGNIPKVCTLKAPSGDFSWKVDMSRINDHWFFQKGWPEFVQDNSLEDSDFLTFTYAGNSTFYVKIFTRNGCRKIPENADEKPAIVNLQENETCAPENPKHNGQIRRSLPLRSSIEKQSVIENPSFSLSISKSHFAHSFLCVPMKFWRMHMRKGGEKGSIVTLWIKNNKWSVHLSIKGDRIKFIGGDFPKFFTDNSLKIGIVCNFKLIDSNELAFEVTIDG